MERPPLGGEGYQWGVNSLIEFDLHFDLSREKRAIRYMELPLREMSLLVGMSYQRDGASSRFTNFDYFH